MGRLIGVVCEIVAGFGQLPSRILNPQSMVSLLNIKFAVESVEFFTESAESGDALISVDNDDEDDIGLDTMIKAKKAKIKDTKSKEKDSKAKEKAGTGRGKGKKK